MRPAPEDHHFHPGVGFFGYLIALSGAVIASSALTVVSGYANTDPDNWPIWMLAATQSVLWLCFLAVVLGASRWWGTRSLRQDYGLRFRAIDVLGIPAGVVLQVVFVDALYWLLGPLYRWLFEQTSSSWFEIDRLDEPARGITDRASGPASIAVLFILLVIGAPLIEELLFRGLVLRSFTARNKDSIALVLASVLFAFGHFQPLQFPALVMFGLVVGFVALKTKRLGASVFIHVGFNAATTIALLLA